MMVSIVLQEASSPRYVRQDLRVPDLIVLVSFLAGTEPFALTALWKRVIVLPAITALTVVPKYRVIWVHIVLRGRVHNLERSNCALWATIARRLM